MREVLEALDAVADRALSDEAAGWLRHSALPLAGPDFGVGTPAERATLVAQLKVDLAKGSFGANVLAQIERFARGSYLSRWGDMVATDPPPVGPERLARAIADTCSDWDWAPSISTGGGVTASGTNLASGHLA